MTKRRLKGSVKRCLFVLGITMFFLSFFLITKNLKSSNENDDVFVMDAVLDPIVPVTNMENTEQFTRPYTSDKVKISKYFYSKDDTTEKQENSLIYYENTYLQNSGVIYGCEEEFSVVSVYDGTIIDVKQDDILNTIVYVSHNNSLTTIYYGLKDVQVKVNDAISKNTVLGTSNTNKFATDKYSFLFEVNVDGKVLNPETFYTMNINELN